MIIHNMKNVKSSQEIMKKKKRDQRDICKLTQNISHAQWDLIEEDLKEIMISSNTFKQVKENILEWFKEFKERQVDLEY